MLTRGHSSEVHRQACTVTDWFTCSSNTTVFPLMFWCLDLTHRFRYVSARSLFLHLQLIILIMLCYAMLCHTPTSLFFSPTMLCYACYVTTPTPISKFSAWMYVYEWVELNGDEKTIMITKQCDVNGICGCLCSVWLGDGWEEAWLRK